jgi:HPt (histidine-containing phosphotransfer) domain-containing protein
LGTASGNKNSNPHPDINWRQLHELSGNDQAFEQELLQIFLEDSHEQMGHLNAAWAAGDLNQVRLVAHHIKGASANVGAVAIARWASQIEADARSGTAAPIAAALNELSQSLQQLEQYISAL